MLRLNLRGICQGYGLTEAYEGIAKMDKNDNRPGSCGKLMTFVTCKIRNPNTGETLGLNQIGELCLKGPMIMMGYYKNEKATKETFTEDGWLRTGDLARYDEQKYFYIVDRLKELIKYNGYQVSNTIYNITFLIVKNAIFNVKAFTFTSKYFDYIFWIRTVKLCYKLLIFDPLL